MFRRGDKNIHNYFFKLCCFLKEIAKKMNFKYEIYKVPDNRYGSELPNGSWDGLVRELIDKVWVLISQQKRNSRIRFSRLPGRSKKKAYESPFLA